jgi:hypothetical protein
MDKHTISAALRLNKSLPFLRIEPLRQNPGKVLDLTGGLVLDAVVGAFALAEGAMMIFLRRARNALWN